MPLLPQIVGGIEIRERSRRYEGEPRYRRLDFVRPKVQNDREDWDLVRTSQPYRAIPLYDHGGYQYHPPLNIGYQQRYNYQHQWPHYRPMNQIANHRVPDERHIEYEPQNLLEQGPSNGPSIVNLGPVHDLDSDPDEILYEERAPKKKKNRSKSKVGRSGHSIFGSDDEEDEDDDMCYRRKVKAGKIRGRSRSRYRYDSDDDHRARSRRRSTTRGW